MHGLSASLNYPLPPTSAIGSTTSSVHAIGIQGTLESLTSIFYVRLKMMFSGIATIFVCKSRTCIHTLYVVADNTILLFFLQPDE